mmetsp:Transcript_48095/g.65301  ORF Transcript_48095/g.65301 Transcript_48095/m.65301 type:complete len:110 (-) Transcript_48095:362-691(-)
MDTNEIGFFMNCNDGNSFSKGVLNQLYLSYKKFKNSIFVVYDQNKAKFGLNPLKAFRLSEKATNVIGANPNINLLEDNCLFNQAKIASEKLTVGEFFEEVAIKVQRSHI